MGLKLTEQKTELAERMRNDQKNRSKEILGGKNTNSKPDPYKTRAIRKCWKNFPTLNKWAEGYYYKRWFGKGEITHKMLVSSEKSCDYWPIDPDTLCLCTGETDKEGNTVWENDVLEVTIHEEHAYAIVRFGRYASSLGSDTTEHIGFFADWSFSDHPDLRKDLGYWLNNGAIVITTKFDMLLGEKQENNSERK